MTAPSQERIPQRRYARKHRDGKRRRVERIKTGRGCAKCGENHPAVLDFHHIDRETKTTAVSTLVSNCRPWDEIEREIFKCVVLCANCHRKEEYARRYGNTEIVAAGATPE